MPVLTLEGYGGPVCGVAYGSADRVTNGMALGGIDTGGALLTLGGAGDTTVSTTAISGAGGLTKDGPGTLTLSGANTYTGPTTVSNGTLVLSGGAAIADAGVVNLQ
jgi:autotransporter-associated beta strand protein